MRIPAFKKTYDGNAVLDTPELSFDKGKIYGILGPNGSGKSTFAKVAAGIIDADDKNRKVDKDISIRYMPQKSYPFRMSIQQNILLSGGDIDKAKEMMKALNLEDKQRQKISSLSGGEAAKIAFIRTLMRPCDLLILDEPTAAMDIESAMTAERLIDEYRKETGCAILLVTHDLFQARRMVDEAVFLDKGKLIEQGSADKVLYEPDKEMTKRFLDYYGSSK